MSTNIMKNSEISLFKGVINTVGVATNLEAILNEISSDKYKNIIEAIRTASDKEHRNYLKRKLPAVTFAGTFSKRSKEYCSSPSGIACLDFDGVYNIEVVKSKLSKSKYCLVCFTSPSGNGLKMLVRIPLVIGDERYKEYYNAVLKHYASFKPDSSTKDISRLCFLSYDPKIYVNPDASVFTQKVVIKTYEPKVRSNKIIGSTSESSTIKRLFAWWERKHWDGLNRNNSLYKLAAAFCEFGVSEESAWSIIRTYEESDLKQYELRQVLKSAYKRVVFNNKELV